MQPSPPTAGQLILITGPTRSGKSEWAEALAAATAQAVVYLATSQLDPQDQEWQQRVAAHRQRRPAAWTTLEVPLDLATAIATATADRCLLVDSLGTWLANHLEQDQTTWEQTCQTLLLCLQQTPATVILVAEETGWGVVPAYPLGRQFRDRLGELVRRIGAIADTVYLVTGGYALNLSLLGTSLPAPKPEV